jgi:hypothetical protein
VKKKIATLLLSVALVGYGGIAQSR